MTTTLASGKEKDNGLESNPRDTEDELREYSQIYENPARKKEATFIEVIKQLTPSVAFKDSVTQQQRSTAANVDDTSVSSRFSRERGSVISDRGSVLSSSFISQHTDSGYDTGQTSSSTSYHSELVTSNEGPDNKVGKEFEEGDELVTNLLEDIASLVNPVPGDAVSENAWTPTTQPADEARHHKYLKFGLDLQHGGELKKAYSPSPQGSPATPRRFKSPDCLRTRGMDFEEKWCYFETITSPPEEFRDISPTRRSEIDPQSSSVKNSAAVQGYECLYTSGNSESIITDSVLNTSVSSLRCADALIKTSFSAACTLSSNASTRAQSRLPTTTKVTDSNNNITSMSVQRASKTEQDGSKSSPVGSPRLRRTVRRVHRPKQNAGTNTESCDKGKLIAPSVKGSSTTHLKRESSTPKQTRAYTADEANSNASRLGDTDGSVVNECSTLGNIKVTSPILKRLFSTTLTRGLQVDVNYVM